MEFFFPIKMSFSLSSYISIRFINSICLEPPRRRFLQGRHRSPRMRNLDQTTITRAAIARHAKTTNRRLKTVMTSLVRHLHGFAREVDLTEAEWVAGIEFLTAVGPTCSPTRQEFILLSDTLGLSTLVTAQNHRKPVGCTEATVFGPFHVEGSPERPLGADVANGAEGEPCFVRGSIRGLAGEPVAGAVIEVWQADAKGLYDVQYEAFDERDPSLDSDAVFGVRSSLVADWVHHEGGPAPDGRMLDTPFSTLDFDFVLNPARKEG